VVSASAQVDHNTTTNFASNEHFTQANITALGTIASGNVDAILPSNLVSSSNQLTIFLTTGSNDSSEQGVNGSLRLTGDIIAENYIVSSSVTHMTQSFSSGSTIFGDSMSDTHQFTGSLGITGSISALSFVGDGSNLTGVVTNPLVDDMTITGSLTVTETGSFGIVEVTDSIVAPNNITAKYFYGSGSGILFNNNLKMGGGQAIT